MAETLYRKYRPQKFSGIIGQEAIKQTLQNEIISGRIAHAYLFSGPRGTGKTTMARILAKALNCLNLTEAEPCNDCEACQSINQNRSFDFIEIDAASNRGIDEIRELREHVKYPSATAKYKVYVIDEVHMLTKDAFNALLKTLEEPPAHAIFILATTENHKIPETIMSRCQCFDFQRVKNPELLAHLRIVAQAENLHFTDQTLGRLVKSSGGYVRDALSRLGQLAVFADNPDFDNYLDLVIPDFAISELLTYILSLMTGNSAPGLKVLEKQISKGQDLENFLTEVVELGRLILIAKITTDLTALKELLTAESLGELEVSLKETSGQRLAEIVQALLVAQSQIKTTELTSLPLELLLLRFNQEEANKKNDKIDPPKPEPLNQSNEISENTTSPETGVSLSETDLDWPEILKQVKVINSSLYYFLMEAKVLGLDKQILTLGFVKMFNWEKVSQPKYLSVLEQAINQQLGIKVRIKAEQVSASLIDKTEKNSILKTVNQGLKGLNMVNEVFD